MHTPGPWICTNDGPESFTITADVSGPAGPWKLISEIWDSDMASARCTPEEIEANAHLIAAAPDLLAAAKRLYALMDEIDDKTRAAMGPQADRCFAECEFDELRAAIAKAEARS